MKPLVTVTRVGDSIRISKVTAHGEEIIEADAEARALAILLWAKMTQEEPTHGNPLIKWDYMGELMSKLTGAVERLTARIDNHAHAMSVLETKMAVTKPTPVPRGQ